MKKSVKILTIAAIILSVISCGQKKGDVRTYFDKMLSQTEKINKAISEAAADKKIDQKEADKINKMIEEFNAFGADFDAKMKQDSEKLSDEEKTKKMEETMKIVEEYNDRFEKMQKQQEEMFSILNETEGSDLIKWE